MKDKNILLGITGSIAAYKIAGLCSMLIKTGADVNVIMTENATRFISPMTFETLTSHKCIVDTFDRDFDFSVEHISLARQADAVLVAPATANIIGKLANGIADDMLSTTVMACRAPVIVAPAMNTAMYENSIVQENIAKLKAHGMTVIEPAEGYLACGDTGAGKMPEPDTLFSYIERKAADKKDMEGKRILVTAGSTREAIDPVRFITNRSTGRMGFAIARAAMLRGAEVTLVSGPVEIAPPEFVDVIGVESARDMADAVKENARENDIIIMCAAVADMRPADVASEKIKKKDMTGEIRLERTEDILEWLGQNRSSSQTLVGFSMETEDLIDNSKEKLDRKNCDMIVANSLKDEGAGFGTDTNVITIITRQAQKELPLMTKSQAADCILDEVMAI